MAEGASRRPRKSVRLRVAGAGCQPVGTLLDLDASAGFLELALDRVGLVAGDAVLDRLRGRIDQVLRLLEAEARDRADDLDHLDLLVARTREHDVERRLLLGRSAVAAAGCCAGRRDG